MNKLAVLVLCALPFVACDSDNKTLPEEPPPRDIGFTAASYTYSRSEDSVGCTYRFLASWSGGNAPIAVTWRSASSRFPGTVSGERIDIVISKTAAAISEAALIEMSLRDADDDTTSFSQSVTLTCAASSGSFSVAGAPISWKATDRSEPDILPFNWNIR